MADYYVKLSAATKTSGGLTSSDPFGGLAGWNEAVSKVKGGETIYLMAPDNGGDIIVNYTLNIRNKEGSSGNYITVKPHSTDVIKISGGDKREWPKMPYNYITEDPNNPGPASKIYIALLDIRDSKYISIENITLKNSGSEALKVYNEKSVGPVTIKNVIVTNCVEKGMRFKNADNVTIDGCTIEYCDCDSSKIYNVSDHGAAVAMADCDNSIIKNTTIHDNAGEGLMIDTFGSQYNYSEGTSIYNCKIYNNMEVNIYIHSMNGSENKAIYNNLIYNTPDSYYRRYFDNNWKRMGIELNTVERQWTRDYLGSCDNVDIYNNIFAYCSSGIVWATSDYEGTHNDNIIENNTFIYNDSSLFVRSRAITTTGNNVLRNNISIIGAGQNHIAGYPTSSMFGTNDYNCWHEEGGASGPSSTITGANDINDNPDLLNHTAAVLTRGSLNPSNYIPNYDASPTSPVIDAGADTSWTTDYFGNTRSAGNFDMGFAEGGETEGAVNDITPKFQTDKTETGTWPDQYISEEVGTVVTFSDNSAIAGSAVIDDRLWVFEGASSVSNAITAPDGTLTATRDASPTVTWSTVGNYRVTYTVFDATYEHLAIGKTVSVTAYARIKLESGGAAGIVYDVVTFESGDTTINHSLGVVPHAAIFVYGGVQTLDTNIDNVDFGFSVCDTSPITCAQSNNAAADGGSVGGFRRVSTSAVKRHTTSDSVYVTGTLTAVSSTALTMSWAGTTTNTEIGYVILFGGSSISAATATTLTSLNAAGNYEDVSGDYNVAIALSTLGNASQVTSSIGFAVDGGNQVCFAQDDRSASVPSDPAAIIYNNAIAAKPGTNAYVTCAFYDSYTRFTLNGNYLVSNPASDAMHVLLMNIGSVGATCGVADSPTTTGNNDYSLSFDPGLLIAGLSNLSSVNTKAVDDTAGAFGIFATDDTVAFTYGYTHEDAAAVANYATYASGEWRQLDDDQTERSDNDNSATGVTLGTSKFTVNLDPAGGGKFIYLAFEDAGDAVGTTAKFTYYRDNPITLDPVVNETLNFVDASVPESGETITNWDWDFDDGNTSTSQNPTHSYGAVGTYNVTLTVTDSAAGEDTSDPVTIYVEPDYTIDGWSYTLDPNPAIGEAPYDVEVDWSATSIDGFTVDATKSYVQLWYALPYRPGGSGLYVETQSYYGYGTAPTITVTEGGIYNLGIKAVGTDSTGAPVRYMVNIPDYLETWDDRFDDIVKVYDDENVYIEISTGDDDWRTKWVGPKEITFTLTAYPSTASWTNIDWDYGDTNSEVGDADGDGMEISTNEYAAVTTETTYTVEAEATFSDGLTKSAYTYITIVPAAADPRNETETLALMEMARRVSGCIATTDWSKTGGQTNVYEATLDRRWSADTARILEDGALLTSQASIAAVDGAAGSYYCTYSAPDLTIYVHTTGSDNPATNGSDYRFIRPA